MVDNPSNPGTPPPPPGGTVPPPPPPPSSDDFNPQDMFSGNESMGEGQLDSGKPTVAASPTRVFMVLGIMGVLLLYLLYSIFFSSKEKPETTGEITRTTAESGNDTNNLPPPPDLTPEIIPTPPPITPPVIPEPQNLPEINQEQDEANNKAMLDRLKSNMLIANSAGGLFGGNDGDQAADQLAGTDANLQFGNLVMRSTTKAPQVTATRIGNLTRTIAQGRIIQATMETAINTDLPGPIRAIVSRDIYGEAGSQPLIPKGSRLIGQYNSSILFGQSRVYVMWTRVIRPDGVDVAIGSPLIDQIGQAGIGGTVDNKFREMFSRAVLSSIFSIAVAMGVDATGMDTTTSTTVGITGGTQTSGDAAGQATVDALQNLGDVTTGFVQRFINVKPTITVDQGTAVLVFVNRDVIFPSQYMGGGMIP